MPEISRFYGIRITMNFVDHSPPHFHATYADEEAQVEIATGDVMAGSLPRRAAALVKEWTSLRWTPDFGRPDKVELPEWEAPYQEQDDGREATSIRGGV